MAKCSFCKEHINKIYIKFSIFWHQNETFWISLNWENILSKAGNFLWATRYNGFWFLPNTHSWRTDGNLKTDGDVDNHWCTERTTNWKNSVSRIQLTSTSLSDSVNVYNDCRMILLGHESNEDIHAIDDDTKSFK